MNNTPSPSSYGKNEPSGAVVVEAEETPEKLVAEKFMIPWIAVDIVRSKVPVDDIVKTPVLEMLNVYVEEQLDVAPTTSAEAVTQGDAVAFGVTLKLSDPSVIVIDPDHPET